MRERERDRGGGGGGEQERTKGGWERRAETHTRGCESEKRKGWPAGGWRSGGR